MHTKTKFEIGSRVEFTELDNDGEFIDNWSPGTVVAQTQEHVIVDVSKPDELYNEYALNIHDYEIRPYKSSKDKIEEIVQGCLVEAYYCADASVIESVTQRISTLLISKGYTNE
jgi:hypothetical protein